MNRNEFVTSRTPYHRALLLEKHPDIPPTALDNWAQNEAEKEWRQNRVYDAPVQVQPNQINVYGVTGRVAGATLRFNPNGPMVSLLNLSHSELRELTLESLKYLLARGEWYDSAELRAMGMEKQLNLPKDYRPRTDGWSDDDDV